MYDDVRRLIGQSKPLSVNLSVTELGNVVAGAAEHRVGAMAAEDEVISGATVDRQTDLRAVTITKGWILTYRSVTRDGCASRRSAGASTWNALS